ncbi:hypothetical protein [Williamsia sp. M5A3_1d]
MAQTRSVKFEHENIEVRLRNMHDTEEAEAAAEAEVMRRIAGRPGAWYSNVEHVSVLNSSEGPVATVTISYGYNEPI